MNKRHIFLLPVLAGLAIVFLIVSNGAAIQAGDTGKPMTPEELNSRRIVREGRALEVMHQKDLTPPLIVHRPLSGFKQGRPITLRARISDESGVASAQVHYRTLEQQSYNEVEMAPTESGEYRATIPGYAMAGQGVAYYIAAVDIHGNGPSFSGTQSSPHIVGSGHSSSGGGPVHSISFVLLIWVILAMIAIPSFFR